MTTQTGDSGTEALRSAAVTVRAVLVAVSTRSSAWDGSTALLLPSLVNSAQPLQPAITSASHLVRT